MSRRPLITLFTDAGLKEGHGTYGWWAKRDSISAKGKGSFKGTHTSTYLLEAMALANGLVHAFKAAIIQPKTHVLWQCDNLPVVTEFKRLLKLNPEDLDNKRLSKPPFRVVLCFLRDNQVSLTPRWIKGHSSEKEPWHAVNKIVDRLATEARKEKRDDHPLN